MEIGGETATLSGAGALPPLESRLKPRLGPAAEAASPCQFTDRAEPRVYSRLLGRGALPAPLTAPYSPAPPAPYHSPFHPVAVHAPRGGMIQPVAVTTSSIPTQTATFAWDTTTAAT